MGTRVEPYAQAAKASKLPACRQGPVLPTPTESQRLAAPAGHQTASRQPRAAASRVDQPAEKALQLWEEEAERKVGVGRATDLRGRGGHAGASMLSSAASTWARAWSRRGTARCAVQLRPEGNPPSCPARLEQSWEGQAQRKRRQPGARRRPAPQTRCAPPTAACWQRCRPACLGRRPRCYLRHLLLLPRRKGQGVPAPALARPAHRGGKGCQT